MAGFLSPMHPHATYEHLGEYKWLAIGPEFLGCGSCFGKLDK